MWLCYSVMGSSWNLSAAGIDCWVICILICRQPVDAVTGDVRVRGLLCLCLCLDLCIYVVCSSLTPAQVDQTRSSKVTGAKTVTTKPVLWCFTQSYDVIFQTYDVIHTLMMLYPDLWCYIPLSFNTPHLCHYTLDLWHNTSDLWRYTPDVWCYTFKLDLWCYTPDLWCCTPDLCYTQIYYVLFQTYDVIWIPDIWCDTHSDILCYNPYLWCYTPDLWCYTPRLWCYIPGCWYYIPDLYGIIIITNSISNIVLFLQWRKIFGNGKAEVI